MLLLGKTQEKHPGDRPPTVPNMPSPEPFFTLNSTYTASSRYFIILKQSFEVLYFAKNRPSFGAFSKSAISATQFR